MAAPTTEHVPPVYLMCRNLPAAEQKEYTVVEICSAAELVTGYGKIEGCQRIGGLWRLYANNSDSRVELLTQGLVLRGHSVTPRDKNPFIVENSNGEDREIPATRLTVGNIPLSYNNEDIIKVIEKLNIKARSRLMDERARDERGKLTRWKTGRRFIYIDVPAQPLPKTVKIGQFTASLFHKEQKTAVTCSNCLMKGHHHSGCEAPVKCKQCLQDGHKAGAAECQLAPPPPPPPSANKETKNTNNTAADSQKEEETPLPTLTFPSQRRSRSHTPARGKRERSPSSPRTTAALKTARVATASANPAEAKLKPGTKDSEHISAAEDGMEEAPQHGAPP